MLKYLLYRLKKVQHLGKTLLLGALPANIYYRFPSHSLKVIAITGTDGKTTSSTLTYHILQQSGKKVALISTVAAYIGDTAIDTGFHVTTPEPWPLQQLLRKIADQGYEYVVLETTSHGIYQFRTWGIRPYIAGLTNITNHEALDYHLTYDLYVRAKVAKLNQAQIAVINHDDISYKEVKKYLSTNVKCIAYSVKRGDAKEIMTAIKKRFSEPYNHANSLLVWNIVHQLGVTASEFTAALPSFEGVPGRMQMVSTANGKKVIVDFAHTPNALYQALTSVRASYPEARIITVFGCAGLRDPNKRFDMGKIASELADAAVFTAEDPRTEDIWTILRQMSEHVTEHFDRIHTIPDRQLAIDFAYHSLARRGDVIIICGKGHEQSLCYGTTEYMWDDRVGVQRSL